METNIEKKESFFKKSWVQTTGGILLILLLAGSALLYKILSSRISIDQSLVSAPVISISPENPGILEEVFVKEGDSVKKGDALARVGGEVLSAKVNGIIIEVNNTPGQFFNTLAGASVIKMIDPTELRIVGKIKETEGLTLIKVGDPVSFTVDAFSGQTFTGVVDSIAPTSSESGLAFSISDKRETKEFEVKVKYDVTAHTEFKNGMSAKMKVYPKK
jgi:multidrug resistance efflux pump